MDCFYGFLSARNSEVWRTVRTEYFIPASLMVHTHCLTSKSVGWKSLAAAYSAAQELDAVAILPIGNAT